MQAGALAIRELVDVEAFHEDHTDRPTAYRPSQRSFGQKGFL